MKRVLIPIILTTALSACRNSIGPAEESGAKVIDIPMLKESRTEGKPTWTDIMGSIDTIRLGGTVMESFIDHVSGVKFSSDLIFVQSSDVLNIFDYQGNMLTTIKHKGRGPGEYIRLTAFDIIESQRLIYILDTQSQQVIIYDFDGKHVRHFSLDCGDVVDFAVLPNGHMLLMKLLGDSNRGLYEADENGGNIHPLYEVEPDFKRVVISSGYLIHINDSVIGCLGQEDTDFIYHFQNGTLTPAYKIKTDIVISQQARQRSSASDDPSETYFKGQYWEIERYMGLSMNNNDQFVFAMYDKDSARTTRYYKSELTEPDSTIQFVPSFEYCYKGKLINAYDSGLILTVPPLHEAFPEITEDSNPVLLIFTLK